MAVFPAKMDLLSHILLVMVSNNTTFSVFRTQVDHVIHGTFLEEAKMEKDSIE